MAIDFLLSSFCDNAERDAIVWRETTYGYRWLLDQINYWRSVINENEIAPGTVVTLEADFSPNAVALFLTLIESACILVPLTSTIGAKQEEFIEVAEAEVCFTLDERDDVRINRFDRRASHELYKRLRSLGHPGLVLFSSGSTGKSKAAVHDLVPLLEKFKVPRHRLRTISFLLYDHIGGINTMLYTLSNGGCLVTVRDRSPDGVLRAVEAQQVQLLPTSPTFINLVLISETYKQYKLDSLETLTYGTEPMPASTLQRFHQLFPDIRLVQTYGLSEVGILRSKSKSSDSLWVKIGGEGFETRVINGILHIKAQSAMLGYLNAPSPFTEDGWMNTGDQVELDGEYLRLMGRQSEIINVGGEKVYPAEVESVIQEFDNVAEVTVFGEKNPITGNIVCAKVTLSQDEDNKLFTRRLKSFCRERLQNYKVPIKVVVTGEHQHSARYKKVRLPA
ncbi:MAG: fatty acid--CoA ligase family protein [Acidobacteriota bacterium]|nr:fatty acid--CoA ligase family protein [Acidobacteriota bacterium]